MMQQQFYEQPRQQQVQQVETKGAFAAPKQRSFLKIVFYLLSALPLGIGYFVLLVAGFSLGFGALAIWIGLPILYVTLLVWLWLASFERAYTMRMLNMYIEPPATQRLSGMNLWQSLKMRMTDPATWKSLFYLLMKFPFGIFSFTLTVTLLTTSIAIIISPLSYLITTLLVALKTIPANTIIHVEPYGSFPIDGQFRLSSLLLSLVGTVVGISLLYISRIILNFVAYLWGEFARMMLGRRQAPQPMEAREFVGRPLD